VGVEVFGGAPVSAIGGIGGTALFDANQKGSLPIGGQINIGPQLRAGANLQIHARGGCRGGYQDFVLGIEAHKQISGKRR